MKKVLVGGVFSVLHPGHEYFLKKAKSMGDFLVVVIASDRTVMRMKGVLHKTASERKTRLEKTGIPDKVVIGSDENHFRVVEEEKPDVIVLGYDQEIDKELLQRIKQSGLGPEIVRIEEKHKEYSSNRMVKKQKKG